MITIFTIGFTNKSAKVFFELLEQSKVKTIVDTRINNVSQLAGYTKGTDLSFFARRVANIGYEHKIEFAPTKELLNRYRKKQMSWAEYEIEYLNLLDIRNIKNKVVVEQLNHSCLLCSEHLPDKCHRRLLAEYLQKTSSDIQIIHLK
ncbi:DUF488 domain-containing protein [Candidatus Chloroploca sp. M-50]|uniref:DUF488 domain-containing protein n=1 Tax=Candidatus Chloroploca mongolica TaxID=2528176 RepID=A0ABS4DFS9_9CHLR|nr:DUF488 domain-containing protein [Candidatus Chloroploca mongolica]MBP1468303.1 DUF488 domain-containing protein [Candidatus Chloroploca mongolica]